MKNLALLLAVMLASFFVTAEESSAQCRRFSFSRPVLRVRVATFRGPLGVCRRAVVPVLKRKTVTIERTRLFNRCGSKSSGCPGCVDKTSTSEDVEATPITPAPASETTNPETNSNDGRAEIDSKIVAPPKPEPKKIEKQKPKIELFADF